MGNPCKKCLDGWIAGLDLAPQCHLVRFLPDDTLWANRATLAWLGADLPAVLPWGQAIRWCCAEDVDRLESAYSRCIKLMREQTAVFRMKIRPHKFTWVKNHLTPWACSTCPRRCAMVLVLAYEVPSPSTSSPPESLDSFGDTY